MNRVKYTTATTGTGNLTLSIVTGFQTLANSVNTFNGPNAVIYTLLDVNETAWETGSTLTRTDATVFESTNANNRISLTAGTHTVLINRSFYDGHTIMDSFIPATTGVVTFSTATQEITWAQEGEDPTNVDIDGSDDCPGASTDGIASICSTPANHIPYCRGYSLHLRARTTSTQAGEFFGIRIDPGSYSDYLSAAWAPIENGAYISCSTPIIQNPNPFTGIKDFYDQDSVGYSLTNTSGASISVYPQLYITWYI